MVSRVLRIAALLLIVCSFPARGASVSRLAGVIADESGRPVAGAELFVYDSPRTRRPADFISPRTGMDGKYILQLPAGRYWVVARVRQSDKYGPILPGDRHSGDPMEIDLGEGGQELALTVADIRDLARAKEKAKSDVARLSGRILDQYGRAADGAYAAAWREPVTKRLPDAVSGWTDSTGEYLLFLPAGNFAVSAIQTFPPPESVQMMHHLQVGAGEKRVAFDLKVTTMEKSLTVEPVTSNAESLSIGEE